MASLNLRPLGDRVVIKPLEREEVTKSGIRIARHGQGKATARRGPGCRPGRVLDTGERVIPDVKQGERVLFAKYSGTEFKLDQDDLLSCASRTSWPS